MNSEIERTKKRRKHTQNSLQTNECFYWNNM